MSEQSSVLQHWAERAFKAEAEIKRLRRERNLAVEMLQSAERELAAERERCARIAEGDSWHSTVATIPAAIAAAIRKGET